MTELKDHISALAGVLDDSETLHSIAENFAKKNDVELAHEIYSKIVARFPEDEKAKRKYLFYQAFKDPKKIEMSELPPLELVTDYNKMRSIEMDYLTYKGTSTSQKAEVDKTKVKKVKKRIRKIRWPKNFDPCKANQAPADPERWLPKLERKAFAKLAKKHGLLSKTQGTTANVSQTQTKQTFQQGPSTATQEVAGGKAQPRKKGMRRK